MEEEILSIQTPVVFDESIAHQEIHAHKPYTSSTFNNSDEIRITVQHQDSCVLPSKSSLHISGKLLKSDGTAAAITTPVNNAICHLFEDPAERFRFAQHWSKLAYGKCWMARCSGNQKITDVNGNFDVVIPLSMILDFAEDYRKVIVNAKHELILTRSKSDSTAIVHNQHEDFRIVIDQVECQYPT
ncbi:uncharacterized protein [Neodiprion pinetum]|uniref:uncharacterized protein n=1 Tax=Neodiprion pinetum TaxID=441929 RepID=UPI003723E6FB